MTGVLGPSLREGRTRRLIKCHVTLDPAVSGEGERQPSRAAPISLCSATLFVRRGAPSPREGIYRDFKIRSPKLRLTHARSRFLDATASISGNSHNNCIAAFGNS